MDNFTVEAERVLMNAGWIPGRQVDISELRRRLEEFGFIVNEAAEHFLSEFGGLVFNISGSGVSRARERFVLDPLLAIGEDDRFAEWSETVGETLTPIGELDSRYFLGMSESGEIYSIETWLGSFGLGKQALENLILGVAAREIA